MKKYIEKFKKLLEVSCYKTFILNLKYFGIKHIFKPLILVSKNTKILRMNGKVVVNKKDMGKIRIGFGSIGILDSKYNRAIWDNNGTIEFRGSAYLGIGAKISNSGYLTFGDGFCINANSDIVCMKSITFGDDVLVSWDTLFMDCDFHPIYQIDDFDKKRINDNKEIVVGDHCWIGCRCTLLKGTYIANNCIIAAGSTLTKEFKQENSVISSKGIIKIMLLGCTKILICFRKGEDKYCENNVN